MIASVGEDGCLVMLALETARSAYDTSLRIGLCLFFCQTSLFCCSQYYNY